MLASELNNYSKNPRRMTEKMNTLLESSLSEYGDLSGIVFNQRNKSLVGGHQRSRLLKDSGKLEVTEEFSPAKEDGTVGYGYLVNQKGQKFALRLVDWDEEKHAKANLIANKVKGDFDMDILANEFEIDMLLEVGFEESELGVDLYPTDDEKENEVPEVPKSTTTKLGDVYQLGKHRIMCGDSTDPANIEKLMDGKHADIWVTDPPYNVKYEGKTKDALTIDNDSMDDDSFLQFLTDAFSAVVPFLKEGGSFYIWHADSEGYNFRKACKVSGLTIRQCLVWNKNAMVMGRQDYHWKHEPCLYGWKDGAAHTWNSDRTQTTILDFNRPTQNKEHPTMKPVELIAYQITNNSLHGELVLDTFLGSGTTVIASEKTGRVCYGMELDPIYVDVAVKRWETFTGKKAIKL